MSFSTVLIYSITEQQNHLLLVFVSKIKTLKTSLSEIRLCSKKSDAIAASFTVPHIYTSSDKVAKNHAHTTVTFVSWKVVSSVYTDRARLI